MILHRFKFSAVTLCYYGSNKTISTQLFALLLQQDLQMGSKVVAADNVTELQVSRIERQKATKFILLERLGQVQVWLRRLKIGYSK